MNTEATILNDCEIGKERIVAVLPGNGRTLIVRDFEKEVEEEALAFIVVEVTCRKDIGDDGVPYGLGVRTELRAVSVEFPMIEYSPYPDEEFSYRLVQKEKNAQ